MRTHLQVLLHCQVVKDPAPFNHLDKPLLGDLFSTQPVNAVAHKLDRPISDLAVLVFQQAGDRLQGSALSGPVCPEKGHDATSGDLDGYTFENQDHLVVLDLDIIDLQDGFFC